MPNFELSRNSVECDRCGEVFTDESTYISHGEADHGDKEEDFEEVADTYELKMDPNLTESNLRKAKILLRETSQQELHHSRPFKNPKAKIPTKLEPHNSADDLVAGVSGYNDDPNSFFYNNKKFRKGSSSIRTRTSHLGEARAREDYFEDESGNVSGVMKYKLVYTTGEDYGFQTNSKKEAEDTVAEWNSYVTGEPIKYITQESRRRANEVGTEICTCGHFGGSTSEDKNQHDDHFQQGHGACRNCECAQFTWTPYEGESRRANESTYTCGKCGEVGDDFSTMAGAECPSDLGNGHQIPMLGDRGSESETSNYEVDVDEFLKTGVAIQKTGGGRSELEINNDERITGEAHDLDDQSSDFQFHKSDSSDLLRTDQPERNADGSLSRRGYYSNDQDRVGRADYRESKANEVGTEICTCGHLGGSTSEDKNQHETHFQQGHGGCKVCQCAQFTWTPYTGEADNYPQKAEMTNNEWEKDLRDLKTRYETEEADVKYDVDGTVSTQGEEQPVEDIPALTEVDFGYEKYESYPTIATETKKKKASEVYDGIIDQYEKFQATEDEDVTEMVTAQKLQGSQSESIAKSLTLRYGVSREDALEKVYSIEVSNNDRVANTFFQKKFSECSEAEIAELRLYCGSDE